MSFQRTLSQTVVIEGIGLHSGQKATAHFVPAPASYGIHLVRKDLPGEPHFKLTPEQVMTTDMATTLGQNQKTSVSTVEHALSAVAALGIDNLKIEVFGPEMPILDGSSKIFYEKLTAAGLYEYKEPKYYFKIQKPVKVGNDEKYAHIFPYSGLKITNTIDFSHPSIGEQHFEFELSPRSFAEQIMGARTFGFMKDVEALRARGLALGGSLENAVVLDHDRILNPEGLRYKNEFVRHKILDAIGDMMTLGHPLLGHLVLYKSGHDLMNQLMKAILSQKDSYSICQLTENDYKSDFKSIN
jgi:UDP-3-O-[3-hydroxymyristoyl] N-acetylglucosamine deacetylase